MYTSKVNMDDLCRHHDEHLELTHATPMIIAASFTIAKSWTPQPSVHYKQHEARNIVQLGKWSKFCPTPQQGRTWGYPAKWNTPGHRRTHVTVFSLYEVPGVVSVMETISRMAVTGGGRVGDGYILGVHTLCSTRWETFSRWMIVMGAQQCECTWCH